MLISQGLSHDTLSSLALMLATMRSSGAAMGAGYKKCNLDS